MVEFKEVTAVERVRTVIELQQGDREPLFSVAL